MVAYPYHPILPLVNWNVCDISLSNEISFLVYHLISSLILNRNWIFISCCYFKCVCKVILKNITIIRTNYNHEIHIFSKVNIKLLINSKIWNTIIRFGRKKNWKDQRYRVTEIKNLNRPALSSHAERTGAEVDFFKHGGRVVKRLTTHLDIDVSVS